MITLSSYFLIAQARNAYHCALPFLLFSMASAFCLLAGFAMAAAANGTIDLAAFGVAGKDAWPAFVMLAVGFLDQGRGCRCPCLASRCLCGG